MSPSARMGMATASGVEEFYVVSGQQEGYAIFLDVWIYYPAVFTWQQMPLTAPKNGELPLQRRNSAATLANGLLFIYGGLTFTPKGDFSILDELIIVDTVYLTFTQTANPNTRRLVCFFIAPNGVSYDWRCFFIERPPCFHFFCLDIVLC